MSFSEQLWLFNSQVNDSTAGDFFFHPLNGTEHGSHPSLTTRDRELVSVLEVRIEPGGFEPKTSDSTVHHSTNSTMGFVVD